MNLLNMADLDLRGKRVLIREDLNVPVAAGEVTSDARIRAAVPSLQLALKKGARLMIMSHRGRPKEGTMSATDTMAPIAKRLQQLLGTPVRLLPEYLNGVEVAASEVVLFENIRCNPGEKNNDETLARQYAALCDVFVMDAFGTAHRAQASTYGVAAFAPLACAGPLLDAELKALKRALTNPARPMIAIVGGAKVSSKLAVLDALADKVDQLIVGGGIANTFISAMGLPIGKSLAEPSMQRDAQALMAKVKAGGGEIPIPTDVVVGKALSPDEPAVTKAVTEVAADEMIFDIGPQTAQRLAKMLKNAGTIIWNGPVGVYEFDQFGAGTEVLARAIAAADAFSMAGGGDTLGAVEKYAIGEQISYISTGGGAFLEYIEGRPLPAVTILQQRAQETRELSTAGADI